jgi:DnaJ-class molecular chaperone
MKVLVLVAIVGVLIFFIMNHSQSNQYLCERCEGKGFWKGLRGERNHCKACDGTGSVEHKIP